MKQSIAHIALVVDDYDEAIKFYTEKLDFTLLEDTAQSETKRWVKSCAERSGRMLFAARQRCRRRTKKQNRQSNGRASFSIFENR